MAELADAPDLGSGPASGVGSSPTPRTTGIRFANFGEQLSSRTVEKLIVATAGKNICFV